jgi:tetratricopeptide (TPR) repeat protein
VVPLIQQQKYIPVESMLNFKKNIKMKRIFNIALVMTTLICFGCTEDLDLYPLTARSEGNFYKNEEQMEMAVNEVQRVLANHYNGGGLPDLYGESFSDNTAFIIIGLASDHPLQIMEYYIHQNNTVIGAAWDNCYSDIHKCNNLLFQLEKNADLIDGSKLERMKGQAILVRSLIYFNMVRAWGAIPYVDKKINYQEAYEYLRREPEIIYENLINDLNYSKEVLPESYSGEDIGRVTKFGASAILAKIYLTIGDKEKAKSELEFIINSNMFSLDANGDGTINTGDLSHIFAPGTKNSKSSILEAQYMAGSNGHNSSHLVRYAPFKGDFHLPDDNRTWQGGGWNTPTEDIINEFELNDPRKEISLNIGYISLGSGTMVNYPYTMKFYDPNWNNPGQNFEIIRYADILLMYAEVTNDPQYLNMVRERAGMPAFGTADYPSDKYPSLELAIEHERRIELCFEFHRFFDLKRNNRAVEVINGKGFEFNEDELLWPIPENAIDINPKLTQNPGY